MSQSDLEAIMALHIRANNLPEPEREYRFAPPRRWRFDFAWPAAMLALEVEGGVWSTGGHTSGKGFTDDCEKMNEALVRGWRVLRVTGQQVKSGAALDWLRQAMGPQGAERAPF
jgi:very-short-patch-repair endonuclease